MSCNATTCFIFENGSDSIKYGLSTREQPIYLSARPKNNELVELSEIKKNSIIDRGVVKNWNALEDLYSQMFSQEFNKTEQQKQTTPVMLITEPTNSLIDKEKICQLLFEKYLVESINLTNQAVLALMSYGLTSGVVLNSGNSYTTAISVSEGNPLKHSAEISNIGGRDLTEHLRNNINLPDEFKTDYKLLKEIKEKSCQIKDSDQNNSHLDYELPDGTKIKLDMEKLNQTANISFETYLIDYDLPNVQDLLFKSISKTQIDFRKFLYSNIILTGGNTMCRGLY